MSGNPPAASQRQPALVALLGGTADTRPLAERLLARGFRVVVSTATDQPLTLPEHPGLSRRIGALDRPAMAAWLRETGAAVLLDAAHPYAEAAHATAIEAAKDAGRPYFRFVRPAALREGKDDDIFWVANYDEAARVAFSFGVPVLVTTGARHLTPYAEAARQTGQPWVARVLPREDSVAACRAVGLPPERIVAATGPFSEADNRNLLQARRCGVLVTKDGGDAGGLSEKLRAARRVGARLVVIRRPETAIMPGVFHDEDAVVEAVGKIFADLSSSENRS